MESIIKDHVATKLPIHKQPTVPLSVWPMPGRLCSTQLLLILDYLTCPLDNGYSVDVTYLDFQKPFNTVPHQCLLQKLTSFGIHGNVLKAIYPTENNNLKLYLMAIRLTPFQLL